MELTATILVSKPLCLSTIHDLPDVSGSTGIDRMGATQRERVNSQEEPFILDFEISGW